jgi:hypothetical protein
VSDLVKLLQSKLKRKGLDWTRQQVRDYMEANQGCSFDEMADKICSQPAVQQEKVTDLAVPEEKAEEIKTVASQMQIELPVEAIQQIASSVNYAIASRAEFLQELRGAIREWAKQVNAKLQQNTEQVFEEIGEEVNNIMAADNQRIIKKSAQLKVDVEETVKTFRAAQAEAFANFRF